MMNHLTLRIRYLLVTLLLLAACDDTVGPRPRVDSTERPASFSGPDVAVLTVGSSQTVEYFCVHPDQEAIDINVLEFPAGAKYEISDLEGPYSKKISLTWAPGYGTDGLLHTVRLLAHTRSSGSESVAEFDIYVNAK